MTEEGLLRTERAEEKAEELREQLKGKYGDRWEAWEEVNVRLREEVGELRGQNEDLERALKVVRKAKGELRRQNEWLKGSSSLKDDRIRELADELDGRGGEEVVEVE